MGACTEIDASTCIRSYELHEPRNIPHLANFIYPRLLLRQIVFARCFTYDRSIDYAEPRIVTLNVDTFMRYSFRMIKALRNPDTTTTRTKNRVRTAAR